MVKIPIAWIFGFDGTTSVHFDVCCLYLYVSLYVVGAFDG